ncbi:MAG: cytidylate kinase-like family protein [Chloroflexi bacterium]|nr:cytidylate kinase-like family protein [Chloroflexota bacterium]
MIVTISRQAASRGDQVARRTAERLAVPYINPEVVARAALRMGLEREDLTSAGRAERLGDRLALNALDLAGATADDPDWALRPQPTLYDHGYRRVIEAMIGRMAASDGCVIAGYPAQVLLGGGGRAIHALVVAPLAIRVQRMMLREDLPAGVAERVVRESDRDRLEFYRRLYDVGWDDPALYDCVLNTARLSVDEAATVVLMAAEQLYGSRSATT